MENKERIFNVMDAMEIAEAVTRAVIFKDKTTGKIVYLPEMKPILFKSAVLVKFINYNPEDDNGNIDFTALEIKFDDFIKNSNDDVKRVINDLGIIVDDKIEYQKILFAKENTFSLTDTALSIIISALAEKVEGMDTATLTEIFKNSVDKAVNANE